MEPDSGTPASETESPRCENIKNYYYFLKSFSRPSFLRICVINKLSVGSSALVAGRQLTAMLVPIYKPFRHSNVTLRRQLKIYILIIGMH